MASHKPRELEAAIDGACGPRRCWGCGFIFYGAMRCFYRSSVVDANTATYCCDDGSGRLCPAKPAVYASGSTGAGDAMLFAHWPQASGLVMRTGEVYPEATAALTGSPLAAGSCAGLPGDFADRSPGAIHHHDARSDGGGRESSTFTRAWTPPIPGVPHLHDDPGQLYQALSKRLPKEVVFSFKYTRRMIFNIYRPATVRRRSIRASWRMSAQSGSNFSASASTRGRARCRIIRGRRGRIFSDNSSGHARHCFRGPPIFTTSSASGAGRVAAAGAGRTYSARSGSTSM